MDQVMVGSWLSEPVMVDDDLIRPDPWERHPWMKIVEERRTDAGITITPDKALEHTPLWHGLLLLGGDAGSLDIELIEQIGDRQQTNTRHAGYKLASVRPNGLMCPNVFWEMMMLRAIVWGNSLAEIKRNRVGFPLPTNRGGGLKPLPPDHTEPFVDENGKVWVLVREKDPAGGGRKPRYIDPFNTIHINNLTTDGFWGRSLIWQARNRLANGLGLEMQHNRFMGQGMQPDWLFTYPVALDPEDQIEAEKKLDRKNRGLRNVGRSLVMDQDVKATQLGMTFEAAQFAELVQLDIVMVASLLGIPAIMLNAMEKMTFSNMEDSERWYINRTLRRWLNKITQELAAKLLSEREQERFRFEHNLDPLLKGRLLERFEAHSKAIAARIKNPNEVRAEEGLNPYEGGDEYANPNTLSGGGGGEEDDDERDEEKTPPTPENKLRAAQLRNAMRKEDNAVADACLEQKNFLGWLNEFYHGAFMREMFDIVPGVAEDYCAARCRLWVKISGHVSTTKALREIVKAQKQTDGDRVAGLLTEEMFGGVA